LIDVQAQGEAEPLGHGRRLAGMIRRKSRALDEDIDAVDQAFGV